MNATKRQDIKIIIKKQSGQTLVEFILLLSVIAIISFTFMARINGLTGERWQAMAEVLLEDENQPINIR